MESIAANRTWNFGTARLIRRIALRHSRTEFGEFLCSQWRTRVMRRNAAMRRGKAERESDFEWLNGFHLPIEPCDRVFTKTVRPTETGSHIFYPQCAQPAYRAIQPMIFKIKPLTNTKFRSVCWKQL